MHGGIITSGRFATCAVAVNYSRFIWLPNYEATFLVLWGLSLFAWCIGGRRGWFAVSAILLLILIEITLVAVLLIHITVVAWLLTSARPGPREYGALAVVALLVLSPTLLWESITHGLDFQLLLHSSGGQPSTFSLTVLLAAVLFLIGIGSRFPVRIARYGLNAVAGILLVVCLIQLAGLPGPPS